MEDIERLKKENEQLRSNLKVAVVTMRTLADQLCDLKPAAMPYAKQIDDLCTSLEQMPDCSV